MADDRWTRIEGLFHEALARPASERSAFLDGACGGDAGLRQEVLSLLLQDSVARSFLETPAAASDTPALIGRRLGPYRIDAPIGAGGMGEVYRARDTKLGRDVAIKILPGFLGQDPDRLARLGREARVLAALNHPNIGAIYGLEEADGIRGLVLELIDGETLAVRIARKPLPVAEALRIAAEIADALQAAHDKGIVHRDLKPANIKITTAGTVKVLDFGLAKAAAAQGAETTLATRDGVVMGTPAYMSPEQARGESLDQRTDVWAFGCVLYETLTARRAFDGATASDAIAAVLQREPDWAALPAATPIGVRRLLTRCLSKDLKRRLYAIGDARIEIDDAMAAPASDTVVVRRADGRAGWRRALPWSIAAAGLAAACAMLILWAPWRQVLSPLPLHLSVELGADVALSTLVGTPVILSPDGTVVAFVGVVPQKGEGGSTLLYLRRLTQLQAAPLTGTDNGRNPFFSPDGQSIAFFADGKLKKISVTGGATVTLCPAPNGRGGSWGEDGTIAFSPDTGEGVRLLWVSSEGGAPLPLTTLAEGEVTHRWPQMLPGGHAVLYTASRTPAKYNDANLVVQRLPAGERKVVWRGGYSGRYLQSSLGTPNRKGGHLVFMHDETLFAVPFDLDRLEVTGQPVPALEGVKSNTVGGGADFDVSTRGTLVYLPEVRTPPAAPIYWMDHEGKTTPLLATPANWFNLRFARDGRLAVQIDGQNSDIYEIVGGALTPLIFDPAHDIRPVWTPEGRGIAFASERNGQKAAPNLYWQRADGTGEAVRLTTSKNRQAPTSWNPNGKFLAFHELNPQTTWDVMILPMEGDDASGWKAAGTPIAFLHSDSAERDPMFSPDGRWLAYTDTAAGAVPDVYVRPYPGPGGMRRISTGGGVSPTWSRAKPELFYGHGGQIMVVPYTVEGDSFRPEPPRLWSAERYVERAGLRPFDLHPDGERFALAPLARMPAEKNQDYLYFIFEFFDELRRIAPVTKR